jgi:peptide/nickel transport system permease protein
MASTPTHLARQAGSRLLQALLTLWIISVLVFLLGQWATDDPVSARGIEVGYDGYDPHDAARRYASAAKGWADLPLFYVSAGSSAEPDTAYRLFPPVRKERLLRLAHRCGSWAPVADYDAAVSACIRRIERDTHYANQPGCQALLARLAVANQPDVVDTTLQALRRLEGSAALPELDRVTTASQTLWSTSVRAWPRLRWHGLRNQYHQWLSSLFGGSSDVPGGSVWRTLRFPLCNTMLVSGTALVLAIVCAVPLGIQAARTSQSRRGRALRGWWLLLYAMPVILIGCVLRYLFATPGHGFHTAWMGGVSVSGYDPDGAWWPWAVENARKMILPILTIFLHILALLVLQIRTGMLDVLHQDYIRTARAKGLTERRVLWRHALPGSLYPLITTVGALLPMIVGGTLVTEAIFPFHGIGEETLQAFLSHNVPVLMAIVLLVAAMTLLGSWLAEVLYRWVDPRVE